MNKMHANSLMDRFSISRTMANLMLKYDCATPEDYRALRTKARKSTAPKKAVKEVVVKPTPSKKRK